MPHFGSTSTERLATCHPDLQRVFLEVVKYFDCTVAFGFRGEAAQNEAFRTGHSRKKWPESKHNTLPSIAIDIYPYPVNWKDTVRFYYFAGFVMATATALGIELRWGGDWDRDTDLHDQTLFDLGHFELLHPRPVAHPIRDSLEAAHG